jgi:hypothetical protein
LPKGRISIISWLPPFNGLRILRCLRGDFCGGYKFYTFPISKHHSFAKAYLKATLQLPYFLSRKNVISRLRMPFAFEQ